MNNNGRKTAELLHLFRIFKKYEIEIEDIYEMGNLAIMIDYYVDIDKYHIIKNNILKWFSLGNNTNAIFIIINAIQNVATERKFGDMEKISKKMTETKERYYRQEIISYVPLVENSIYFPDWFIKIYDCMDFTDKAELYSNLLDIIKYFPNVSKIFESEVNIVNFRYFIDKCLKVENNDFYNKEVLEILDYIGMEDVNSLCWVIFDSSHKSYVTDLYKLKNKEIPGVNISMVLRGTQMNYRVHNNLYKKKELFFFTNISKNLCSEFAVEF